MHKGDTFITKTPQTRTESGSSRGAHDWPKDTFTTPSEYSPDPSLHQKCALRVHRNTVEIPAELEFIIGAWPDLPEDFKEEMIEMIMRVMDKE